MTCKDLFFSLKDLFGYARILEIMPKKTRQEKILARLHRLEKEQNNSVEINFNNSEKSQSPRVSYEPKEETNPTKERQSSENINYAYVYSDLKKTLFFAAVAVIFQVVLGILIIN